MDTKTGSDHASSALKERRSPSPSGSSSSGEIKDDSDGEIENVSCQSLPEATRKRSHVECRRNEWGKRELPRKLYNSPPCFDRANDYRRPYLTPEQIYFYVRKLPSPDMLADLSDLDLRRLLADVHELDREQNRLANNRRKLLDQMRQMHKQELGSLRECMETLRYSMNERGMNLMATYIGQDVMEFLREKGQYLDAGATQPHPNLPCSSSESCPDSFGVFPTVQSFAQDVLPSRPPFVPEQLPSQGIPLTSSSTIPGSFIAPPPDFSVPPPLIRPPLHGHDQIFEGAGTSMPNISKNISATSLGALSLSSFNMESDLQKQLRNKSLAAPYERDSGSANESDIAILRNGSTFSEKGGIFGFGPPGTAFGILPPSSPVMPMMGPQHSRAMLRDGLPVMDDCHGLSFSDGKELPSVNGRIVPFYEDARLPFHEYEHPQGEEAIRIRHVWNVRSSNNQRRISQSGINRDRKIQRIANSGRKCQAEVFERSRLSLDSSETAGANTNETGTADGNATCTGENSTLLDENSELETTKIDQS